MAKTTRGKRLFWGALTIILGFLFLLDVAVPDLLPLVDEIAAGGLTLASGVKTVIELFRKEKGDGEGDAKGPKVLS